MYLTDVRNENLYPELSAIAAFNANCCYTTVGSFSFFSFVTGTRCSGWIWATSVILIARWVIHSLLTHKVATKSICTHVLIFQRTVFLVIFSHCLFHIFIIYFHSHSLIFLYSHWNNTTYTVIFQCCVPSSDSTFHFHSIL